MVEASYNDGRTARTRPVRLERDGEVLVFQAGGEQRWPLAEIKAEMLDDCVRLADGDGGAARLTVPLADWRGLTRNAPDRRRAQRRRRVFLAAGVGAAALGLAALVFVGIPAASGPLARHTSPAFERRIGETFAARAGVDFPSCGKSAGQSALSAFGRRLAAAAGTPFDIRVSAVHAAVSNAYALPGGAILVTDRLIDDVRSPDELSAVIAHEIAHVQRRHVMQAAWRSMAFAMILDAIAGRGAGAGQQLVLLAGSATNLRYSRDAEAEADRLGQDLLVREGLSSQGMAPFFQRLANPAEGKVALAAEELVSDHPDAVHRAEVARARAKPGAPAFGPAAWGNIKAACHDGSRPG